MPAGYSIHDIRFLPIGQNNKVIEMMKNEFGGKIMTDFVFRAKMNAYKKICNISSARAKRRV